MKFIWILLAIFGGYTAKWYWDWYKQGEIMRDINAPGSLTKPTGHLITWGIILLGVFAIYKLFGG